jgi:hypothetical protein
MDLALYAAEAVVSEGRSVRQAPTVLACGGDVRADAQLPSD